ncbi:hypothetical protein ES703_26964 [subsurface metagenome]
MEKVIVVARSFQAGTGEGGKEFDPGVFEKQVATPIRRLLKFEDVVKGIIVVTNGETGNLLAEIPNAEGITPTMRAITQMFSHEVTNGRIITHLCTNWGPNPGSAIALNEGLEIAKKEKDINWILNWSPEIEMDGYLIRQGLAHAEQRNLSLVGFLRQNWWERPQWNVVQNTAALWKIKLLSSIDGFSPECNETDRTIPVEGFGEVAVAGMEDFHAMLRILKQNPDFRWGMIGRKEPLFWDTSFKPGSEREQRHLSKVARQYAVMQIYTKDIFPELPFEEVMNKIFSCYHQD